MREGCYFLRLEGDQIFGMPDRRWSCSVERFVREWQRAESVDDVARAIAPSRHRVSTYHYSGIAMQLRKLGVQIKRMGWKAPVTINVGRLNRGMRKRARVGVVVRDEVH